MSCRGPFQRRRQAAGSIGHRTQRRQSQRYLVRTEVIKIHIIRHGKTEANEKRLYCGQTDLPLSEAGRAEIASLVKDGIYPPAGDMRFFTSGMIRTNETLAIIYGSVPKFSLPDFSEYNFGEFEMHSYDDLKNRKDYQAWISDSSDKIACPAGESKEEFYKRVITGFNKIKDITSSAFIVCHGGVIACIMEHLYPREKNFYEWQPSCGRGYTLMYEQKKFIGYKEL